MIVAIGCASLVGKNASPTLALRAGSCRGGRPQGKLKPGSRLLRSQQLLHQRAATVEDHTTALVDQLPAQSAYQVRLAGSGWTKEQYILPAIQKPSLQEHTQVMIHPQWQPTAIKHVQCLLQGKFGLPQPAQRPFAVSLWTFLFYQLRRISTPPLLR